MATSLLKGICKAEQVIILLAPLALFLIPLHSVDGHFTFCIFKNIFGHNCPGCGITHAIISALHLNFVQAWHYNRLVVVVLPLLAYLWGRQVKYMIKSWNNKYTGLSAHH